jgi:tetratricopeptide (TPR) repeat protein
VTLQLALLMALSAAVETPAVGPAPPVVEPAPENRGAEQLFRKGVAAYGAGDFRSAIDLFEAAYRISKAREIRFDIGQAYRSLGECRAALDNFDAFVAAAPPDDPLLPKAKARQAELATCAAPQTGLRAPIVTGPQVATIAAPPPPQAGAATLPRVPVLQLEARPAPGRTKASTVCIAATSSAAALAGVGLGLGLASWSESRTVGDATVWNDEARRADARGRAFADASLLTLVTAGVAGLVSAASCWINWRGARSELH